MADQDRRVPANCRSVRSEPVSIWRPAHDGPGCLDSPGRQRAIGKQSKTERRGKDHQAREAKTVERSRCDVTQARVTRQGPRREGRDCAIPHRLLDGSKDFLDLPNLSLVLQKNGPVEVWHLQFWGGKGVGFTGKEARGSSLMYPFQHPAPWGIGTKKDAPSRSSACTPPRLRKHGGRIPPLAKRTA